MSGPAFRCELAALVSSMLAACSVTGCVGMSVPTSAGGQALISGDLEVDVNRLGNDYKVFDLAKDDPELCRDACDAEPRCKAFTYVKPGLQGPLAKCWLKDPAPAPRSDEACCVSGLKP
jgi:hypothetical protein